MGCHLQTVRPSHVWENGLLAIPADACPRSPGVLVVQLYSWAARCSLRIRLNLTFSFSGVSSHHSLIANTGCQTSSSDSRIKGLGSRVQARGLSLKGQTLGSRCQTQTLEHRLLQDPCSRLQAMKDQLKTPKGMRSKTQNQEVQTPRTRRGDPDPESKTHDPSAGTRGMAPESSFYTADPKFQE